MKCPKCNGTGVVQGKEQWIVSMCRGCDGKGEIELTHQEYIQNCTTEELAEVVYQLVWLGNELFDRLQLSGVDSKENDIEIVKEWLREKKND